ncbi:MAG: saccharopine dehydrogenase family protein [Phycisphaerales bacterium]
MATNAIVLGAGLVGAIMARDLADDPEFRVTVADIRPEALAKAKERAPKIKTVEADLGDEGRVRDLVGNYDLALGALASPIGFQTLRAVIDAGVNFCDICFMPEDALDLDEIARERGVTAVVDCGVAPGMSNMLVGYAEAQFDRLTNAEIYVGGLPIERHWPFHYKAGFSPFDVIEEYTRPSRLVENGEIVVREALSEPELMEFPGVGTLEAFNTDGLRSLATTIDCPSMKEKTLRYPGHIELMRVLRAMGLFSHEEIEVGRDRVRVRPIDVTSALLFPMWKYEPGEPDLTIMRVIADGEQGGERVRVQWDLLDAHDPESDESSMARTTAFPCAIVARLVARGEFRRPGVNPPEFLGREDGVLDRVLAELETRGIRYLRRNAKLEDAP